MSNRAARYLVVSIALSCGAALLAQSRRADLSRAAPGRRRRRLLRHEGRRSVPVDGGSQRARGQGVGRRGERRHVQVSRRAADARRAARSGSPSCGTTRGSRRRTTKGGTGSTPATAACSGSRWSSRARRSTGPETVALDPNSLSPDGSIALSGLRAVARRAALRLRPVGRRLGLVDLLRPRARQRQAAARRDPLGEVQQPRRGPKDGKGFFYGRYPEPPAGKALEDAVKRQEDLLPRARHGAVGRSADLRAAATSRRCSSTPTSTRPAAICSSSRTRARATRTSCS